MIRTRNKIYGEENDPDTVISTSTTTVGRWLKGGVNKTIYGFLPGANKILVTDGNGNITTLSLIGRYNKVIGTDDAGNIVFIDRSELDD